MKILKIMAICAMLAMSCFVKAECPTQETTVVFMNGVWTPQREAMHHTEKLSAAVYATGVSPDCVHFALSHTQDDFFATDIIEAIVQKTNEPGHGYFSTYTGMLFLMIASDNDFWQMITSAYLIYADNINEAQLYKHLEVYKKLTFSEAPAERLKRRGIMVTHSQGGHYGNEVWNLLSPTDKENARLVTVATPSGYVASDGPNTRLSRDGVANLLFTNAYAEGIIPNTGLCEKETTAKQNSWECHGFETGYLHDIGAREQIVADIVAALPTESSAQYFSTTAGNPGIPGDGRIVALSGEENTFELQPYFPLQAVTNGITVSVFPITDVPLQNLVVGVNFASSLEQCGATHAPFPQITMPLSVNGAAGFGVNISQERLNFLVSIIKNYHPDCADISLGDLSITGFYITDTINWLIIRQLDAVAIGIGENAFPR